MARREITITISSGDRDNGKSFTIREMPAMQAEEWFVRAMMLLARSGAEVPPNIFSQGAMGFAAIGIGAALTGLGKANWSDVKPLLDEMMACIVSYQQPGGSVVPASSVVMAQIEEVATVVRLREEILSLHLGFSIRERLSRFRDVAREMMDVSTLTTSTSVDQPG